MIISRTPFRISFFGGGTDYPAWFQEHGGAVLATTINRYCYIHCRPLPPFFRHKSRIVWSQIEHVNSPSEIKHPAIRGVLEWMKIDQGVEIHHHGDLPARTGLGAKRPRLISRSYMTSDPASDRLIENRVGILTTWEQRASIASESPPRSGPST